MKDKFMDYCAWCIAKLIEPFYRNRHKIKNKLYKNRQLIIGMGVVVTSILFWMLIITVNDSPGILAEKVVINEESGDNLKAPKKSFVSNESFFIDVDSIDSTMIPIYGIQINGKNKVYLENKKSAEKVLEDLRNKYLSQNKNSKILNIYFEEEVSIVRLYKSVLDINQVKKVDQALEYIVKGTDQEKQHELKSGENFWVLADEYNISVGDLIKANPDVVPERLQIGQKISLVVPEPLINVCTVEKIIYDEKIEYEVEYEETNSLYRDEFSVKNKGVYGKKKVSAELVKRDGRKVAQVVLDEDILSEPVKKVVYKGTKPLPPKKGSGSFSKPLNRGVITSGYGNRYHPVYRTYRKHTGVDIATSYGTKVIASDGGQVKFAGWKSGYGKCVIIDHGANLVSLYAHMSAINVTSGQNVYKGKKIGEVGSTGTSTGNHLHFEIRKLGNDVNPNNYINLYNYY